MALAAFSASAPLLRPTRASRRPRPVSRASAPPAGTGVSTARRTHTRRTVVQGGSALALAVLLSPPAPAAAADTSAAARRDGLGTATMCMHVLAPVERYVRDGAWDKARTNINYCTRVLSLRKKMQAAAEAMAGDDDYLTGMEAAGEVAQLLTVADSSVYTAIFIPSEEGVNPEQRQYQRAAFSALSDVNDYLQRFVALYGRDEVDEANAMAKKAKYEIQVEGR